MTMSATDDLALLRRYEPVVCFTEGEMFFPAAVGPYVERCSLLLRGAGRGRPSEVLLPAGELGLDALAAEGEADPSRALCLWFVPEPLRGVEYGRWSRREGRPIFKTSGRLARVGLFARFIDSLFSLSLLLRGTVPGGTAAAAERRYAEMRRLDPSPVYYGRVLRQGGYIVLHYLFFYVMNDWRSSFAGVNDHEADWEQVFVYLTDRDDGPPQPAWVAYASHDYAGDDLRRRWDDPELHTAGTHPVVYAGAGSHASYFKPGEYLTSVPLHFLDPVMRVVLVLRRIWRDVLRQGTGDDIVEAAQEAISIPFVDYARGDGTIAGPEKPPQPPPTVTPEAWDSEKHTPHPWTPVLIHDATPWVDGFRGLWGLDTRDPLSGELAPSGPKYNRDGSVRTSWHDPLGWAGLEKVAPASSAPRVLEERIEELEKELAETDVQLAAMETELGRRELEVRSLRGVAYLGRQRRDQERELAERERERNALRRRRVDVVETLAACRRERARLEAGDLGDPHAH